MPINVVFPNPTVKQVIFQIRFPNLFFIESKIGDLQLKIMKQFPKSALLIRSQFVVADIGPDTKLENLVNPSGESAGRKVWHFESPYGYELNVLNDSLDITSKLHKTYKNPGAEHKFREIIELVVSAFLGVTSIPLINRIGLRYVDECPFPSKDNTTFLKYFNTSFPTQRFKLDDATEMDFKTVVSRGKYSFRYMEALSKDEKGYKLILDFDGFAENIEASKYLSVADELHDLIAAEYESTIKEPVYDYMKKDR
jgi:uncharacterized protein (TIGR04255 family)